MWRLGGQRERRKKDEVRRGIIILTEFEQLYGQSGTGSTHSGHHPQHSHKHDRADDRRGDHQLEGKRGKREGEGGEEEVERLGRMKVGEKAVQQGEEGEEMRKRDGEGTVVGVGREREERMIIPMSNENNIQTYQLL